MTVDQILIALRRAAANDYSWSVSPHEAAALVAEVERLRAEATYLRACVPPTHPADYGHEAWSAALAAAQAEADYGHEAWTAALVDAKKEGARSAVEERDAERAAVLACLRVADDFSPYDEIATVIATIERGEHRREEEP